MFPARGQGGDRASLSVLTTFFNVLPESALECSWVKLVARRGNPVARSNLNIKTFEVLIALNLMVDHLGVKRLERGPTA